VVFLDWLLSRRHCSQNWPHMIVPVREKINAAIQDMPAVEDVANLLRGTCLSYVKFYLFLVTMCAGIQGYMHRPALFLATCCKARLSQHFVVSCLFYLRQVFVCLFHGISHLPSSTIDNIWAALSAIHGPAAYLLNGLQRSSSLQNRRKQ